MAYHLKSVIGVVDGSNRRFSTPQEYFSGTLAPFVNGFALSGISPTGWTELGGTEFELEEAPLVGDRVSAGYHTVY
jgi:hypothetical protein